MKFALLLFAFLPFLGISQVDFVWVDSVKADFSFVDNWEYPEAVFVNQWGQLSCDGLCPPEIERMKDEDGRIYDDSLTAFYALVDTSHLYFTHEGNARVYEYGECHYASASEVNGKIHIQTDVNIATHTSLHIVLDVENEKNPVTRVYLLYNSIRKSGRKVYIALNGTIEMSEKKLKDGIVQMQFDLDFQAEEGDDLQHWDGKIMRKFYRN